MDFRPIRARTGTYLYYNVKIILAYPLPVISRAFVSLMRPAWREFSFDFCFFYKGEELSPHRLLLVHGGSSQQASWHVAKVQRKQGTTALLCYIATQEEGLTKKLQNWSAMKRRIWIGSICRLHSAIQIRPLRWTASDQE